MESQLPKEEKSNLDMLIKKMKNEVTKNKSIYLLGIENSSETILLHEMKQYFRYGVYNSSFGDLVPIVVANALHINLEIIIRDRDGKLFLYLIPCKNSHDVNREKMTLNVFKYLDHYDAVCYKGSHVHAENNTHGNNMNVRDVCNAGICVQSKNENLGITEPENTRTVVEKSSGGNIGLCNGLTRVDQQCVHHSDCTDQSSDCPTYESPCLENAKQHHLKVCSWKLEYSWSH